MTLNGHGSTHKDNDYLLNTSNNADNHDDDDDDDDIEDDDASRVPSSTEFSDMLENEQQPVGNLFRFVS
jgi:hypothetical protein